MGGISDMYKLFPLLEAAMERCIKRQMDEGKTREEAEKHCEEALERVKEYY
ncbi:MAG: hypothetical protein ACW99U_17145 [Candidatus Thorarchaeota archaeon]|jgi:hypothetical protein